MRNCLRLRAQLLLLLALVSSLAFAQRRRITGTVTDDKQAPLSGATVAVKGTRMVMTTDVNGKLQEIERKVNTTVEQALQGRAASVYVTENSGQPGVGISVNIRGISSLGRTQPLYVIDGVQIRASKDVSFGSSNMANPLADLNTNNIENSNIT